MICNETIIIDHILLYSSYVPTILHYSSYVAQVFTKYCWNFKLTKCNFFKPRVKFINYDLTTYGNRPAQSKFNLIKHWSFPPHTLSLPSFIGLCGFYSQYFLWFETNIKPLRKFQHLLCLLHLMIVNIIPLRPLFYCDTITQSQYSSKRLGLLVGWDISWYKPTTLLNLWQH